MLNGDVRFLKNKGFQLFPSLNLIDEIDKTFFNKNQLVFVKTNNLYVKIYVYIEFRISFNSLYI